MVTWESSVGQRHDRAGPPSSLLVIGSILSTCFFPTEIAIIQLLRCVLSVSSTRIILLPQFHKVTPPQKKPKASKPLWSCWKHGAAPFKSQALSEKYQQNAVGCSTVSLIQQVLVHGDSHKVHSAWGTSQGKFCLLISGGWSKGGAFEDKSEKMGDTFFPVPVSLHKM